MLRVSDLRSGFMFIKELWLEWTGSLILKSWTVGMSFCSDVVSVSLFLYFCLCLSIFLPLTSPSSSPPPSPPPRHFFSPLLPLSLWAQQSHLLKGHYLLVIPEGVTKMFSHVSELGHKTGSSGYTNCGRHTGEKVVSQDMAQGKAEHLKLHLLQGAGTGMETCSICTSASAMGTSKVASLHPRAAGT